MHKNKRENKMNEELLNLYKSDIIFLLGLKKAIGKLNNRIHDISAFSAIEILKDTYDYNFNYRNAGASGFDIKAYDDNNENIRLIAEVKTTLPDENGRLRSPQIEAIKKDLGRLLHYHNDVLKVFVVLSQETKQAIHDQIDLNNYPGISILNILGEFENFNDEIADEI